jgi:Cytochrome P460
VEADMLRISKAGALKNIPAIVTVLSLAVVGGMALAAQDRYTLKLGKLSFSDFKGYEDWKNVAVSQTETQLKVILANDVMMKAYRQGLPADGKFFPEGSKIVKIEWSFKKNTVSPYFVQIPDTLKAVDVIEKDTKRFPDTHGWAYGDFNYDAASDTFTPQGTDSNCGYACHTTVAAKDYIFTQYPKR